MTSYQQRFEEKDTGMAFGNAMTAATQIVTHHPLYKNFTENQIIEKIKEIQQDLFLFAMEKQRLFKEQIRQANVPEEEKVIQYDMPAPRPRTKYGKDNCGCRYGRTCDSHKLEFQLDAEQYDKENPRTSDKIPTELK